MDEQQWRKTLEQEGFKNITVASAPPNTDFGEHTHDQHTVHVILEGELTLIEKDGLKILKTGERFEIPAGTTHSARSGPGNFKMLIGVKED